MHQTAKEFMSRSYLWDKIFHSSAGFVGGSDLNLAMLSGLVRRLKCCGEAAFKSDSLQDPEVLNGPPGLDDDPYRKLKAPSRGCELLSSAVTYAKTLSKSCDRFDHYVGLLDELDNAGSQLIKDWKDGLPESFRRSHTPNASWVEFFLRLSRHQTQNLGDLKLKSFLELAVLESLFPYVEAKIRGRGIPRPQLQSLLLRATRILYMHWRGQGRGVLQLATPELSEMLLQEGADPNCRDAESNAAMVSEEGWTAWTGLLQDGVVEYSVSSKDDYWKDWISTVKVFLKYGADPAVRWYRPHDGEDGQAMEIATPDTVINAALADKPQYKKDLADIMELLSKAKANLRPAE